MSMFTVKTESPVLNKILTDNLPLITAGLTALVAEQKAGNTLKEREVLLREREVLVQEKLLELLRRQCRPARPTGLKYQLVSEREGVGMAADILTYSVTVDAPTDNDVVSRKIKLEIDGVAQPERTVPASTTDLGPIEVPQDSQVKLSIVDVDDAGNESPPLVGEFKALDTITPTTPTGLAVTLVSERENPDPAPPVDPAPVDPVTPAE